MTAGLDLDILFVGGNTMFAIDETFAYNEPMADYPIVKPNIRTGEGRRVKLRTGSFMQGDLKKK